MLYWDFVIKELDQNFIDNLASEFDIDYYWCPIDTLTPIEDSVPNQIIKYIYEKAIDKIVENIPEEIFKNMYSNYVDERLGECEQISEYEFYKQNMISSITDTLKDNIYLNYLDSSIDISSEILANEYSLELADYIFESWLINY